MSLLSPCQHGGFLGRPLPALDDPDGARLPESLPPVVDAHVHVFPDRMFEAIWRWFDEHGWPVRHRLYARQVVEFLLSRGVEHIVLLHYAHKPGIARAMNELVADLARSEPRITGMATVFPGEPGARAIVEDAFVLGLRGVKLHCHVQCCSPDAPELEEVYRALEERDLPLVIHAGREPKSPGYRCDPHLICSAERTRALLRSYPKLRVCVPHLGADEFSAYARLLEEHDNLWLDTTMALAGYFPTPDPWQLVETRPERVLYGTDFPNLPFAWDREIKRIVGRGWREAALAAVLGENARKLHAITADRGAGPPSERSLR
jgi:predicted TIM-barrel fold metal-dependent hydrolase